MSKRLPNVCEEPEPVRRVWRQIREEMGINVLHHDRQRVFDIVAHELAEQQRKWAKKRHESDLPRIPYAGYLGALDAADLIDPEVQP